MVRSDGTADAVDARLLMALTAQPRATTAALAEFLGLSRNTVQARLSRLERRGALGSFERRIEPEVLGCPLLAFVTTSVTQRKLDAVAAALARIPEVVEVHGLTGETDLLVRVVARDERMLHLVTYLLDHGERHVAASLEGLEAYVDHSTRRMAPFPGPVGAALDRWAAEHAALPWAPRLSGAMGLRGPR